MDDALLAKFLSGEATDEEVARLRAEIEADPSAVDAVVDAAQLEFDLAEVLRATPAAAAPKSRRRFWIFFASAAALSEAATPAIVPAGAQLRVRLSSNLTSETAQVGDPWSGTLAAALVIGDREILPAGTPVRGAVTGLGAINILAGLRDVIKFRESVRVLMAARRASASRSSVSCRFASTKRRSASSDAPTGAGGA